MDVNMPVMDGVEATKILKKQMLEGKLYKICIIISTACNNEEERNYFLSVGADYLIPKPITLSKLVVTMQDYV